MATLRSAIPHSYAIVTRLAFLICFASITLTLSTPSRAQLTVLHTFTCLSGDGCQPDAPVAVGPNGNVYGTTIYGGNEQQCPVGCGVTFQVSPPSSSGGVWNYSTIYEFGGDTGYVESGLVLDPKGNLYGFDGGVFELSRASTGFWRYNVLFAFPGPLNVLTPFLRDSSGTFYAIASGGVENCEGYYCGQVLQFVPGENGVWTENVLYTFTGGADGGFPAALVMDPATGTLYGVAGIGGIIAGECSYGPGCGTVFKLTPSGEGTWTFSVIYSFTGVHDSDPYALVRDSSGNLYGLALRGQYGEEVFKLSPLKNGSWAASVLHTFSGYDTPSNYCGYPPSFLSIGSNGVLYGDIFGDIDLYFGAIFQLAPPSGEKKSWSYSTIWDFNEQGPDLNPTGVLLGPDGALYGATNGGDSTFGTVFRVQLPSQAPWPPTDFCY